MRIIGSTLLEPPSFVVFVSVPAVALPAGALVLFAAGAVVAALGSAVGASVGSGVGSEWARG